MHEEHITLRTLIRSNTASGKKLLLDKVTSFAEYLGGEVVTESDYPAWEYRKDSTLRELMVSEYEKMYGKKPVVTAMHAGLECGIFAGKRPELDMISVGPDLTDVHTPQETMDVKSVERTWEYLKNVLAALK
jgi:dipeptidase D